MNALKIIEPGKIQLLDIPAPVLGQGEVLLKVERVGLCGSDLSSYLGRNPLVSYPRIPGHEIAGTVLKLGVGVPSHIKEGIQTTLMPYTSCGSCPACRKGRFNTCQFNKTLGVQRDGGLCELISVPWEKLVFSSGLSLDELALVEPLTIGFHAIDRADVGDGDTILVLGCGMIGLGAVARAATRGATVIAADIDDGKLLTARVMGAAQTINSTKQSLSEEVSRLTDARGADVVVEAVGNPATYRASIEAASFAGKTVCIGYAKEDVPIQTKLIVQKELNTMGSRNATPLDFDAVMKFIKSRRPPVERLVSIRVGLSSSGDAFAQWAQNPASIIKVMIDLQK